MIHQRVRTELTPDEGLEAADELFLSDLVKELLVRG